MDLGEPALPAAALPDSVSRRWAVFTRTAGLRGIGAVNAAHEAVRTLSLEGPARETRDIAAVIDTGFTGFLTVTPACVAIALDLDKVSVDEQRFCQCKRAATLSVPALPSEDAAAPVWRPGTPLART